MTQQVWLGVAGELVSSDDSLDYFVTRVGGAAVFPGSEVPAEALSGCRCCVCGKQLSLVLQAYAPHTNAAERVLLVFGCTTLGCGKEAGSYKALRCQIHPTPLKQRQQQESQSAEQSTAQVSPAAAPEPQAAAAAGFDAFAAAGDDWGDIGDWGAPPSSSAAGTATYAFDFSDLTESLKAAGQQQQQAAAAAAAAAKPKSKQVAADVDNTAASTAVCCRALAGPLLPEFYVYAEPEPDDAAAKAISSRELEHVQQLLAAYEAESAAAAGGAGSSDSTNGTSTSGSRHQPAAAAAAAAEAGGEEGSWAGEGYEKEELRGVERGYLKFSKRLARQPHQCARYCLDGPLLWPKSVLPQPSPCAHCGGPRVFELQLMPALIQLTIEAAQMALEQELHVDSAVVDAVANWDWATIAVFTCQASCSHHRHGGSCEAFIEEVALINEQECHVALPSPVPGVAAVEAGGNATAATVTREDQDYMS